MIFYGNINKLEIILFFIIIYPVCYAVPFIYNIGYAFSNYYFLFTGIIYLIIIIHNDLKIQSIYIPFLAIASLIMLLAHSDNIDYKPIITVSISVIVIIYLKYCYNSSNIFKSLNFYVFLYLLLSYIFIIIGGRSENMGRFSGFAASPTTFCVFIQLLFILYASYSNNSRILKTVVYFLFLALVYLSQTRINLLFMIIMPLLYFLLIRFNSKGIKLVIFLLTIISVLFLYPIYDIYIQAKGSDVIAKRYDSGEDTSFILRQQLYVLLINDFTDSSIDKKLFGQGNGHSRKQVLNYIGIDLLPHNDLLRIIVDFGVITSILFLIFIYIIGLSGTASFMVLLLYILCFFHNMIYDQFIVCSLIFVFFIDRSSHLLLQPDTHSQTIT